MSSQRSTSRLNLSEKAKGELMFVGQCVAAAIVFAVLIKFAVGH